MRILIVDDHHAIRSGIRLLLSSSSHWSVCGEATDGQEAVEKARDLRPDIILMDISMPRMDGLEATRIIGRELPESAVIIISQNDPGIVREQMTRSGARGFVAKQDLTEKLIPTIEAVEDTGFSRPTPALAPQATALASSAFEGDSVRRFREMLDALPAAIYTTDAEGRLTHFNPAAVAFSGRVPELGTDRWCVTWKLYSPDGTPLPHDQCPMAVALKEGRAVDGTEVIAERPDGTKVWFIAYPRPLYDAGGRIVGGINMLLDMTDRKQAEQTGNLLAAIVSSSDDAIVSKNLDGVITSWNKAAERMFGYPAAEAVGQHITLIVPADRWREEANILKQLNRGQRVDHFETVRVRKDGETLDVSLTISPVRDAAGRVVGASKVARDVTARKRDERALADAARQQQALFHFADQLHRAASLDDVYTAALHAIVEALECDRASILLLDDTNILRFVGWRGLSAAYRQATEGHLPWKPEQAYPEPICMDNVDEAELDGRLREVAKAEGIGALAFIPLVSHGKLIGNFMLYFNSPHAFRNDELELSLAIARQLAFGIDRKRDEQALVASEQRLRRSAESLDAEVRARTMELEERNSDILQQSEQLRDLSWRLLRTQDNERRHIARELHDSAGQTLTALGMNLTRLVERVKRSAPELAKSAEESQHLVQQLNQEIRTTSYLLHPPLLDESGLAAALGWYTRGLAERSGLDIHLSIPEDFGRLPRDMELVIFRIVQECLTNVHRHSGSRSAVIRVSRGADTVSVEVRDQGKGISPHILAELQSQGSGVGIRGMRERVRQLHGEMKVASDGGGTRTYVVLPVPKDAALSEGSIHPFMSVI